VRVRVLSLALCAVVAVAGGCGTHRAVAPPRPLLARAVAERLATLSATVAAKLTTGDGCGAHDAATMLEQQTMTAIDRGEVPRRLRAPLLGAVGDLVDRTQCPPQPPPRREEHGKGKHKGHKHGEGD
jgi:hypothetical protein